MRLQNPYEAPVDRWCPYGRRTYHAGAYVSDESNLALYDEYTGDEFSDTFGLNGHDEDNGRDGDQDSVDEVRLTNRTEIEILARIAHERGDADRHKWGLNPAPVYQSPIAAPVMTNAKTIAKLASLEPAPISDEVRATGITKSKKPYVFRKTVIEQHEYAAMQGRLERPFRFTRWYADRINDVSVDPYVTTDEKDKENSALDLLQMYRDRLSSKSNFMGSDNLDALVGESRYDAVMDILVAELERLAALRPLRNQPRLLLWPPDGGVNKKLLKKLLDEKGAQGVINRYVDNLSNEVKKREDADASFYSLHPDSYMLERNEPSVERTIAVMGRPGREVSSSRFIVQLEEFIAFLRRRIEDDKNDPMSSWGLPQYTEEDIKKLEDTREIWDAHLRGVERWNGRAYVPMTDAEDKRARRNLESFIYGWFDFGSKGSKQTPTIGEDKDGNKTGTLAELEKLMRDWYAFRETEQLDWEAQGWNPVDDWERLDALLEDDPASGSSMSGFAGVVLGRKHVRSVEAL